MAEKKNIPFGLQGPRQIFHNSQQPQPNTKDNTKTNLHSANFTKARSPVKDKLKPVSAIPQPREMSRIKDKKP